MVRIGAAPNVPLVTSQVEALKGSSVGVYMLELCRTPVCVMVTVSAVGERKSSSVNVREDLLTPCWAMFGMAT